MVVGYNVLVSALLSVVNSSGREGEENMEASPAWFTHHGIYDPGPRARGPPSPLAQEGTWASGDRLL